MSSSTTAKNKQALLSQWLRPELALVVLMASVIGMLIIPLPTLLVDLLIGLNMAVAIIIFLSSFYVERILNFSSFPSVLLFTTLMRLALSVSTSRLILVDADAGHIVEAFGAFVVADNLVVGFVIFAIVTLVQFIVITKGSERIGEVVARFSLDGMPGKQMSIDADLRAEAITSEQAQARRREVERESQLYGSYDGAMKFVKGDAIAGIVIVFVNLFGGIAVGMLQHGMSFSQALSTFTLLTIGDGLVAQIPALLICISAGFIVTRVSGDSKNLGEGILSELFSSQTVLGIAAVLTLLLGLLPGFPMMVFIALSAALFTLLWWRLRGKKSAPGTGQDGAQGRESSEAEGESGKGTGKFTQETVPLILLLPKSRLAQWEAGKWSDRFGDYVHQHFGIQAPQFVTRSYEAVDEQTYSVLIHEVQAAVGKLVPDHLRVLGNTEELELLDMAMPIAQPDGTTALWIPADRKDQALAMGCEIRGEFDEVLRIIGDAMSRNVVELFGVQETKHLMDGLEGRFPELIKETYRHVPVQRLAEVLQRLLREDVSIRNMKVILEALAQWGQREKDVLVLVEHVRGALGRYICAKHARNDRLGAMVLAPETEELVRSGVRQSQGNSFLSLDPAQANALLDRIILHVQEVKRLRVNAVLLVAPDVRRFLKRFIETRLPTTHVLSFSELSDTTAIDIMRTL